MSIIIHQCSGHCFCLRVTLVCDQYVIQHDFRGRSLSIFCCPLPASPAYFYFVSGSASDHFSMVIFCPKE